MHYGKPTTIILINIYCTLIHKTDMLLTIVRNKSACICVTFTVL